MVQRCCTSIFHWDFSVGRVANVYELRNRTLGTVSTNEAPSTPQPLPPHEAPVKHAWPGSGQPSAGETKHTADQFRISGLDDAALEAMLEAECKFAFVSVRSPSASRPALIAPPSPRPRISSSLRCGLCHATEDQGSGGSGSSFQPPFAPALHSASASALCGSPRER